MTTEINPFHTAEAEGRYAAKTMLSPNANPYAESSPALSIMWTAGFNDELLKLRTDLKVTQELLGKKIEEIVKLRRDNENLKREIRYMEFRYIEEYDERAAFEAVEAEMAQ